MLCSKYQQEGATPVSFLKSHNSHQDVVPLASLLHCASLDVCVCVRDSYTYNDTGNIETNEKNKQSAKSDSSHPTMIVESKRLCDKHIVLICSSSMMFNYSGSLFA